jgi:hypothetical protein
VLQHPAVDEGRAGESASVGGDLGGVYVNEDTHGDWDGGWNCGRAYNEEGVGAGDDAQGWHRYVDGDGDGDRDGDGGGDAGEGVYDARAAQSLDVKV